MADEQAERYERYLRLAEGIVRIGIAVALAVGVMWWMGQEPSNDQDWQIDAVRLGLLLTAILVLVRAPGVRWPSGKG